MFTRSLWLSWVKSNAEACLSSFFEKGGTDEGPWSSHGKLEVKIQTFPHSKLYAIETVYLNINVKLVCDKIITVNATVNSDNTDSHLTRAATKTFPSVSVVYGQTVICPAAVVRHVHVYSVVFQRFIVLMTWSVVVMEARSCCVERSGCSS